VLFAGFKYSYRRGTFELFSMWYPTSRCLTVRVAFIDQTLPILLLRVPGMVCVSLAASFARTLLLNLFFFFCVW
jgi:hypothetical protein